MALVFLNFQEEKCTLITTPPAKGTNHMILKDKRKGHFHRPGPAKENKPEREV